MTKGARAVAVAALVAVSAGAIYFIFDSGVRSPEPKIEPSKLTKEGVRSLGG